MLPVLLLAFADTPQRRAWALTCGHSGRTGCDKCGLRASRFGADGFAYNNNCFRGYADLAQTMTFDNEGTWTAGQVQYSVEGSFNEADAAKLLITDEKHRRRCKRAKADSRELARMHPLPVAAENGGSLAADPNSAAQRALTAGGPCYGCRGGCSS